MERNGHNNILNKSELKHTGEHEKTENETISNEDIERRATFHYSQLIILKLTESLIT